MPFMIEVNVPALGATIFEVEKEEDFEEVMNRVVNVFRRIDDKSEVSYKFALNA